MNVIAYKADAIKNTESLAYFNGGTAVSPPATFYLALLKSVPGRNGVISEITGLSYARVAIGNNSTNWTVASNGKITNALQINFPTPTGTWSAAYGWALMSASTGGTMWYGGSLPCTPGVGIVYGTSNTPNVAANALVIQP